MKYIISERQFRIIEQGGLTPLGSPFTTTGQKNIEILSQSLDPHTAATILQIGTAFIPFIGPFISAGIGLTEAGMYYKEGDKFSAGLVGALSLLPLIGKIPAVKNLTTKAMATLASKLSKGAKNLTPAEIEIVDILKENEALIKNDLKVASQKLSPIIKQIESLKPKYIKQFGQKEYDNLLGKLLRNEIDKTEFLKILSSEKKSLAVQGIKGIKMTQDEISKISKMAQKVANGENPSGILKIQVGDKIEDVVVEFVKENNSTVATAGLTKNWGKKLTMNVKNLPKSSDQIKRLIYHEVTHMKDPMPQYFVQDSKGEYYLKDAGTYFINQAEKLVDKLKEIEKTTPKGQPYPQKYFDMKNKYNELYYKYEHSPSEITANMQMIYNSIPDKINSIIKNYSAKFGKKKALETLNNVLKYFKGGGGNIENIIGKRQVEYLNNLKKTNINQYNDLIKKIYQEVQNVKYQL